jgi:hypothetical protein
MQRAYVGTRKGVFTLERRRKRWRVAAEAFLGDPVSALTIDPRDGTLHAALDLGHFGVKMRVSRDAGTTWSEEAAPAYPPAPAGVPSEDRGRGHEPPWVVQKIWALEAGGVDRPGELWAGTIPGGLFRSPDGGRSWELVRPLWEMAERKQWMGGGYDHPGLHSICVDPRDGRRLTVAVSTGGVWRTEDAGASWTVRSHGMFAAYLPPERKHDPILQDAHRVVQCAAAPDVFWCQHHNGVFHSTDGGSRWHEIASVQPSVFGFAVAVHPAKPETAWFVPAVKDECRIPVGGQVVVARTRDGGQRFDVLREGLPQEHAYDLVYRHGLAVDSTGQRLIFGSTSGGVWLSDDEGDSWSALPARLPPVNCVSFGQ